MRLDARTTLTVAALLVVALGAVAAPAAAGDDDDVGVATGDGINSTVDVGVAGEYNDSSGSSGIDCEGQPTHHDCEKGGGAETDAGSVDYTGDNYGDDDDLRAGGGDEVTVAGQGEQATVEFDCTLNTNASADDCDVNVTSSQGDAPGPLGGGDGDDENGADDGDPANVGSGEGINSTLSPDYAVGSAENGSSGAIDCVGQPTHNECDKGGRLALGPLSVDYEGNNYADDDDNRFGGGDQFVVSVGDRSYQAGFDCDFQAGSNSAGFDCFYEGGESEDDRADDGEDRASEGDANAEDDDGVDNRDDRSENGNGNGR